MKQKFSQKEICEKGGVLENGINLEPFYEFVTRDIFDKEEFKRISKEDLDYLRNDVAQISYYIEKYSNYLNDTIEKILGTSNGLSSNILNIGKILGEIGDLEYEIRDTVEIQFTYSCTGKTIISEEEIYTILDNFESKLEELYCNLENLIELLGFFIIDIADIEKIIGIPFNKMVTKINYHILSINEIVRNWVQTFDDYDPEQFE